MIALLLMLALGQPESYPESVHPPGIDSATCWPRKDKKGRPEVYCKAACWLPGKPDGGTYGHIVEATKPTEAATREDLQRQYRNGCRP